MRAVIDIGSNSVRLMLDYGRPLNPKKLATTRLGGGLALTGRIDDTAFSASLSAVREFYAQAVIAGAKPYIFATEAVRAAGNGKAFCDEIKAITGITVDVLDGDAEARIAFLGAGTDEGSCTVIDSGGASTEVTSGVDGVITGTRSVKIGAVRLKSMNLSFDAAQSYIEGALYDLPRIYDEVVAIGGTATALAAADLRLAAYNPAAVHGHRLSYAALTELIEQFKAGDIPEKFPAVSPARAEIILYGAMIYHNLMRLYHVREIEISETDNCEGYLKYKDMQKNRSE